MKRLQFADRPTLTGNPSGHRWCLLATCHGYYTPNTKRVGLTKARITQETQLIGVIVKEDEKKAVREFFELFKTPWEFYQENKTYDVVLITCAPQFEVEAKLLIIYGNEENAFDRKNRLKLVRSKNASTLQYRELTFPIYRHVSVFQGSKNVVIRAAGTDDAVAVLLNTNHCKSIRIGFDLFQEVEYLLWHGQPIQHAQIPTLDIHITMVRDWIVGAGIPLVEVPSCPAGFDFTVCLTHDIDFLRLSNHKFDNTVFGFLYRASFHSFFNFLKGKISLIKLLKNWRAVCLLPGVYLGIVKDYFLQFDRYLEVEKGLVSTFFILPFKNRPGIDNTGQIHRSRAARYDINDITPEIEKLLSAGCEIALHGIDAWRDAAKGREELQRIAQVTGNNMIGTRSHWLYQCDRSPQYLEEAGFVYDSTVGYNETVGYCSGTTQVFRPFRGTKLLELPLHIMDTSLFYTGRMDLAEPQAMALVEGLIAKTQRLGGVLTVNWHDRSMGPERLWDTFYESILARLKSMNVWFATALQAVSWFRARRSVCFHEVRLYDNELKVSLSSSAYDHPLLLLRVHIPQDQDTQTDNMLTAQGRIIDVPFSGDLETSIYL